MQGLWDWENPLAVPFASQVGGPPVPGLQPHFREEAAIFEIMREYAKKMRAKEGWRGLRKMLLNHKQRQKSAIFALKYSTNPDDPKLTLDGLKNTANDPTMMKLLQKDTT